MRLRAARARKKGDGAPDAATRPPQVFALDGRGRIATRAYPQQVDSAWGLTAFGGGANASAANVTVRARLWDGLDARAGLHGSLSLLVILHSTGRELAARGAQVTVASASVWEMDSCWVDSLSAKAREHPVAAASTPAAPAGSGPAPAAAVAAAPAPAAVSGASRATSGGAAAPALASVAPV